MAIKGLRSAIGGAKTIGIMTIDIATDIISIIDIKYCSAVTQFGTSCSVSLCRFRYVDWHCADYHNDWCH